MTTISLSLIFALLVSSAVMCASGKRAKRHAHHHHAHDHEAPTFVRVGESGAKQFYTAHVHSNWLQALEFCHRNGMLLASFESPAELAMVSESLSNSSISHETTSQKYDHEFYWTSGNDFGEEGTFKYLSNNGDVALPGIATMLNLNNLEENCVQIHYINGGYLYDAPCEDRRDDLPLCEDFSGVDRSGSLAVGHGHGPSHGHSHHSHEHKHSH